MTSAIGYIRVSTLLQAEEGISLEAQRAKIVSYCDLHDLKLAAVYADEGISGKRADNRPALQEALKAACENRAVLIVYSLSRLARSTRDCLDIAAKIATGGANLVSISEKIDTTSAMGEFVFTLMAALGQLERKQIGERTKMALAHLRQKGQQISRIPFGQTIAQAQVHISQDDGTNDCTNENGVISVNANDCTKAFLVDCPEEQVVIADMRRMKLEGLGYTRIAARLNLAGVKPKRGVRWYASSVRSVLMSNERRRDVPAVV